MKIFGDIQVVFEFDSTTRMKQKQKWQNIVTENGGIVSYVVTPKTGLVVLESEQKKDSFKIRRALAKGLPVVNPTYLTECVNSGAFLDPTKQNFRHKFLQPITCAKIEVPDFKFTSKKLNEPIEKTKVQFRPTEVTVFDYNSNKCPAFAEKYDVLKEQVLEKEDQKIRVSIHRAITSGHSSCKYTYRVLQGPFSAIKSDHAQVRFCKTSWEALQLFSYVCVCLQQEKGFRPCETSEQVTPIEVQQLAESVWRDALGSIEDNLAITLSQINSGLISKCDRILLELKEAIKKKAVFNKKDNESKEKLDEEVETLSNEFYSSLPHRNHAKTLIDSIKLVAEKQDLCQLLGDVANVLESTGWKAEISSTTKYAALRCNLGCVSRDSDEYKRISCDVLATNDSDRRITVHNIYHVKRDLEEKRFKEDIGNHRLLYHCSSSHNLMGILSRGLLLPQTVVEDFGGKRTDPGLLGYAVYFSDAISTSLKYSTVSRSNGLRYLVVCEVALGKVFETNRHQLEFTEPPLGFNSVHALSKGKDEKSLFEDDEYAIYDVTQQRMKYLVQFSVDDESPLQVPIEKTDAEETHTTAVKNIDTSDVINRKNPMDDVKAGLQAKGPVPLKSVHVRAKLIDLAGQVVVLQEYHNEMNTEIEAKYVFPVEAGAVVCGFEAFINDKHVIGTVKEKEKAHKEYKEAIEKGHGAYLMDQEQAEVFTVSVGNIPAKARVLIKITYVCQLKFQGEHIVFQLPAAVAPWNKGAALNQQIQGTVDTVHVDEGQLDNLTVHVALDMPFDIISIDSPSHDIKMKKTQTKGFVALPKNAKLDKTFELYIGMSHIHVPRMWVEKHPETKTHACMLTFYPELDFQEPQTSTIIILLDCSKSMAGTNFDNAMKMALVTLELLPTEKTSFNVIAFGTKFKELFYMPRTLNSESLSEATNFIKGLSCDMGNTDAWLPLAALQQFEPPEGQLKVFLFSDGHLNNVSDTLLSALHARKTHRVFTFGFGETASQHTLRRLADSGSGSFEYFSTSTKSKWKSQCESQIRNARQACISEVSVNWETYGTEAELQQAPSVVSTLFYGQQVVFYGFIENCTQATLSATKDGQRFSTIVSTADLNITHDQILHRLCAHALIDDFEQGLLNTDPVRQDLQKKQAKKNIIELSKFYSVVTPYTSFVAIEERKKGEMAGKGPSIESLVERENVDHLSYIGWQKEVTEQKTPAENATSLLERCKLVSTYSVSEFEICVKELESLADELKDEELKKQISGEIYEMILHTLKMPDYADSVSRKFYKPAGLNVKTLTGKTVSLPEFEHRLSVADLKNMLCEREGIPAEQQLLVYAGRQLADTCTLADYGVTSDSTVHLILRLRGGPVPESDHYANAGYLCRIRSKPAPKLIIAEQLIRESHTRQAMDNGEGSQDREDASRREELEKKTLSLQVFRQKREVERKKKKKLDVASQPLQLAADISSSAPLHSSSLGYLSDLTFLGSALPPNVGKPHNEGLPPEEAMYLAVRDRANRPSYRKSNSHYGGTIDPQYSPLGAPPQPPPRPCLAAPRPLPPPSMMGGAPSPPPSSGAPPPAPPSLGLDVPPPPHLIFCSGAPSPSPAPPSFGSVVPPPPPPSSGLCVFPPPPLGSGAPSPAPAGIAAQSLPQRRIVGRLCSDLKASPNIYQYRRRRSARAPAPPPVVEDLLSIVDEQVVYTNVAPPVKKAAALGAVRGKLEKPAQVQLDDREDEPKRAACMSGPVDVSGLDVEQLALMAEEEERQLGRTLDRDQIGELHVLQSRMAEVREAMSQNINKVLDRGEKLDAVTEKSASLEESANWISSSASYYCSSRPTHSYDAAEEVSEEEDSEDYMSYDFYDDVLPIPQKASFKAEESVRVPQKLEVQNVTVAPEKRRGAWTKQTARMSTGKPVSTPADLLLLEVTPLTFSIKLLGGVMEPVILRNSTIPTRKSVILTTCIDYQSSVVINVYQGQRCLVEQNIDCLTLRLELQDSVLKGVPKIEVTLQIDANECLLAEALEISSGRRVEGALASDQLRLSVSEVEERVNESQEFEEQDGERKATFVKMHPLGSSCRFLHAAEESVVLYDESFALEQQMSRETSKNEWQVFKLGQTSEWSSATVDEVFSLQALDGTWFYNSNALGALGFDGEGLYEWLVKRGLKSLGQRAHVNILRLIVTRLVVFAIVKHVLRITTFSENICKCLSDLAGTHHQLVGSDQISGLLLACSAMESLDKRFPLLYSHLELASSKRQMLADMFNAV